MMMYIHSEVYKYLGIYRSDDAFTHNHQMLVDDILVYYDNELDGDFSIMLRFDSDLVFAEINTDFGGFFKQDHLFYL